MKNKDIFRCKSFIIINLIQFSIVFSIVYAYAYILRYAFKYLQEKQTMQKDFGRANLNLLKHFTGS